MRPNLTFTGKIGTLAVVAVASVALLSHSVAGAVFVNEGFEYAAGTVDATPTTYNGGTGFSGAWNGVTQSGSNPFYMHDGTGQGNSSNPPAGLTFTGLSTTGSVTLQRKSAPGGAVAYRTIDATAATNMTSATLYFSALVRTNFYSVGNANLALAFGTSDTFDSNSNPVSSAGEALGFELDGAAGTPSTIDIKGFAIDGGSTSVYGGLTSPDTSATIHMVYGEIVWGATDQIKLYNSTTNNDESSFTEIASFSAQVDETQFNTLHVATQQVSGVDEIRFGNSLSNVGVIPEPEQRRCFSVESVR